MFGSKRIRELEFNERWLRQCVDSAEAALAKKQTDDHENRSWVEQGKGTGVRALTVTGGQLLRLEDGRTFFLPTMQMTSYYSSNVGCAVPTSQQIIPL